MNVSVVIPNYNGEELILKNLPKLITELDKYTKGEIEVIVVDDGSEDNSVGVIKKFLKVKLLINSKNVGFSQTVDRGVGEARGELILLLNNDVLPQKGFLEPLLTHFNDPKVFAVGCMDKSVEKNGEIVLRGRGTGLWKRGFLVHSRGEVDSNDTLWVSGGSGMFRKSIWEELGGLNTLYNPFYWEDIDLSYRAQKSGYKVIFENKSVVLHEHEKGIIKKKFSPFKVKSIVYRNQFIFVWTNLTDFNLVLKHFLWLPYYFIKTILSLDFAFYVGFLSAIFRFTKILKTRYNNKRLFILSDLEVTKKYI
ncbi:MAG: glycosyltransferase family 2 protein [Patescibacteria group bacterium]